MQEKKCIRCGQVKSVFDFVLNRARKDGRAGYCKPCRRAYLAEKNYEANRKLTPEQRAAATESQRRYRATEIGRRKDRASNSRYKAENPHRVRAANIARIAHVKRATPPWADLESIAEFYEAARVLRPAAGDEVHVDHIVPLQGRNVCGLHVPENLQLRLWRDNLQKHNKFTHQ